MCWILAGKLKSESDHVKTQLLFYSTCLRAAAISSHESLRRKGLTGLECDMFEKPILSFVQNKPQETRRREEDCTGHAFLWAVGEAWAGIVKVWEEGTGWLGGLKVERMEFVGQLLFGKERAGS